MTAAGGERSAHFPAIEKRYGQSVAHWLEELRCLGEAKYAQQIAFLRERHGFSQAHANALVMHARGSTTTRRYADAEQYFRELGGDKERTARAIFAAITSEFPQLELVIAWNQPMLKLGTDYVFGLSAARDHLLIAAVGANAVELLGGPLALRLKGLEANKRTVRVPVGWQVDTDLLHALVRARLAQIGTGP